MSRKHAVMLAIALGAIGITPVLADPPKELSDAAKKELKTLAGKWRVVKFLHFDREVTPGMGEDEVIVEFSGNTIDFAKSATGVVDVLDPTTDPKCLDFKVSMESGALKKGSTYESIYQMDGDAMTWAVYVGRGKNRPTTLDKPTDSGVMVLVLSRIKE